MRHRPFVRHRARTDGRNRSIGSFIPPPPAPTPRESDRMPRAGARGMTHSITRRDALGLIAAVGALGPTGVSGAVAAVHPTHAGPAERRERRDAAAIAGRRLHEPLARRRARRGRPALGGSAGSVAEAMAASFVHPESRFHHDSALLDRIRLAAGFLERSQSPQGNIDLLTTNFNSPPDTGFVVHLVATAANIGRRARRGRDRPGAAAVPGEGWRRHGRRRGPHAESPLGDQLGAGPDQRALSGSAAPSPDGRVACRRDRHRRRRPVHRTQHAHVQRRHGPGAAGHGASSWAGRSC